MARTSSSASVMAVFIVTAIVAATRNDTGSSAAVTTGGTADPNANQLTAMKSIPIQINADVRAGVCKDHL